MTTAGKFHRILDVEHRAVLENVEGTDAAFCIAVLAALAMLANEMRSTLITATISKIAGLSGLRYRKTADILKVLMAINVVEIRRQEIEGTKAHAASEYTLCMRCPTLGTTCLTLGTERKPNHADSIKEEGKEEKELYTDEFERAWILYKRKGNKKESFDQWRKLSKDDRAAIISAIPKYNASKSEEKYKLDFQRYIHPAKRKWEDRIIENKSSEEPTKLRLEL